jgi:hypothetical protein
MRKLTPEERKGPVPHALVQQRSEEKFDKNELQQFTTFKHPPKHISYIRVVCGLDGKISNGWYRREWFVSVSTSSRSPLRIFMTGH